MADPYNDSFVDELYDLAMGMAANYAGYLVGIGVPIVGPPLAAGLVYYGMKDVYGAVGDIYTEATTTSADRPVSYIQAANSSYWTSQGVVYYS